MWKRNLEMRMQFRSDRGQICENTFDFHPSGFHSILFTSSSGVIPDFSVGPSVGLFSSRISSTQSLPLTYIAPRIHLSLFNFVRRSLGRRASCYMSSWSRRLSPMSSRHRCEAHPSAAMRFLPTRRRIFAVEGFREAEWMSHWSNWMTIIFPFLRAPA